MSWLALARQTHPIGSPILGIIIPAVVLLVSCWVTWALYKHFAK